jgi:hypothetical protein
MTKIAINTSFGGFQLSEEAISFLQKSLHLKKFYDDEIERDNPLLIEIIEKLGDKASMCGSVKIVEIPDDVKDWYIGDYDGVEWVAEGRKWDYEGD